MAHSNPLLVSPTLLGEGSQINVAQANKASLPPDKKTGWSREHPTEDWEKISLARAHPTAPKQGNQYNPGVRGQVQSGIQIIIQYRSQMKVKMEESSHRWGQA